MRQRVCGGVSVWKWSKKAVGGEVKRRECEVRWDEVAVGVVWEGRKRWRQVTKCVRRSEVERVVVGGGVSGGGVGGVEGTYARTGRTEGRQWQQCWW